MGVAIGEGAGSVEQKWGPGGTRCWSGGRQCDGGRRETRADIDVAIREGTGSMGEKLRPSGTGCWSRGRKCDGGEGAGSVEKWRPSRTRRWSRGRQRDGDANGLTEALSERNSLFNMVSQIRQGRSSD